MPFIYLQRSSFLFAAFLFFICSVPFFIFAAVPFFVCSASFLFAALLFCLQRFFFVCSVSFLFAAFLFCLQRFSFVCSVSFLFAACPLWATVLIKVDGTNNERDLKSRKSTDQRWHCSLLFILRSGLRPHSSQLHHS